MDLLHRLSWEKAGAKISQAHAEAQAKTGSNPSARRGANDSAKANDHHPSTKGFHLSTGRTGSVLNEARHPSARSGSRYDTQPSTHLGQRLVQKSGSGHKTWENQRSCDSWCASWESAQSEDICWGAPSNTHWCMVTAGAMHGSWFAMHKSFGQGSGACNQRSTVIVTSGQPTLPSIGLHSPRAVAHEP